MSGDEQVLTVYSREYCHLCHDMVAALEALLPQHGFGLRVIDVDEDAELERVYGDKVPVLLAGGKELCHYFLDPAALDAYLSEIR